MPNGLALCTLHHAAFDRNVLGVTVPRVEQWRPNRELLAERYELFRRAS